ANVQYLLEHGIRTGNGCLLIGGAGGDFPMLSEAERKAVVTKAMQVVGSRAPVVIGAQDTDERVTLELARLADDVGAFAFQVSAPYYYDPSDEDVLRWFRKVNGAVKKSGIMIYNTYWKGYQLPTAVLDQLMELDRVVSLKWSTAEGGLGFMKGVARYADRVAVIDNMFLWPLSGFITHLCTIWPEHELGIYAHTKAGEFKKALDIMKTQNWAWIEQRGKMAGKTSGESPIVRAALELCGRPGGPCRPPSRELTREERAELREVLKKIGAPVV
ncbi:MAG: dihydrodipicolinate synthase family protein, partial [Acidobacteria bacterium]|nr:dihydrodipicolinate synthase family protein [Acidobacteriota bacterium]